MATRYTDTHPQFLVYTNGVLSPAANGEVEFFTQGNTGDANRKDTYQDAAQTTVNANPVPLDSEGRSTVPIFLNGTYNTVIRDSDGNQIDQVDYVTSGNTGGVGTAIVDDIVDLKALDVSLNTHAEILGIQDKGTGGSREYWYDSTSTATADDIAVVEPDTGTGRWRELIKTRYKVGDFDGIALSNDTDTDHDVLFGTGWIVDSTGAVEIEVGTAFTKQIDADFAVGDDAGGFPSGLTLTADTAYRVFVIYKQDGSAVDGGFDTSATAANLIADAVAIDSGWTDAYYARRGWVITDSSSNIINWVTDAPNQYTWDVMIKDVNTVSSGGTPDTVTLTAPPSQRAIVNYGMEEAATSGVYGIILRTDQTSTAPSSSAFTIGLNLAGAQTTAITQIKVDSSSQITHQESTGASVPDDVWIFTLGWIDDLTVA